mmetsp:Transcript_11514/g.21125  ORF Transcript_11514/g.21125 Transcript_11514/m.21125 type:complete len:88 (+) Transcript_11514:66-329(+)
MVPDNDFCVTSDELGLGLGLKLFFWCIKTQQPCLPNDKVRDYAHWHFCVRHSLYPSRVAGVDDNNASYCFPQRSVAMGCRISKPQRI